jgi:hypothetical protein
MKKRLSIIIMGFSMLVSRFTWWWIWSPFGTWPRMEPVEEDIERAETLVDSIESESWLDKWHTKQMRDPEFRAAIEKLEPWYQAARQKYQRDDLRSPLDRIRARQPEIHKRALETQQEHGDPVENLANLLGDIIPPDEPVCGDPKVDYIAWMNDKAYLRWIRERLKDIEWSIQLGDRGYCKEYCPECGLAENQENPQHKPHCWLKAEIDNLATTEELDDEEDEALLADGVLQALADQALQEPPSEDWERDLDEL